jgi:DNA-directed RNA polymerase specialized sigma24 family protein
MPGELRILLERCLAGEAPAWERFASWVKTRGRTVLAGVDKLSEADGDDAVAETLKSLVNVVRRGEIRGASNAEIDAYVCSAIRNRALNVLRGRTRAA